jgi:hypothetical protein
MAASCAVPGQSEVLLINLPLERLLIRLRLVTAFKSAFVRYSGCLRQAVLL